MKWFVIAAAIAAAAPVAAAAQAGNVVSSDNRGQQNAVSNQSSTSPLGASHEQVVSASPALSQPAHNATNNQQQVNTTMEASTTQGVLEETGADASSAAVKAAQSPSPPHDDHK